MRALAGRLAVGLVVLLGAVAVLVAVLHEPLTRLSEAFVDRFGLLGVFVGVLFTDTFGLTHEPVLFIAHAGGLPFWPVAAVASVASIAAGILGWGLGMGLGRAAIVQRVFVRYRIREFMQRYGFWAVAFAALTPFPYSVATWAAGAARVPFLPLFVGSLFRIVKVLFYFLLIVGGVTLGERLSAP